MSESQHSFPKDKIRIALLENISISAKELLNSEDYSSVETYETALSEDELCELVASGVHILGIRSKSQITEKVLKSATNLLAVGCFCIGTNQVDLVSAANHGVAVFNAPYSCLLYTSPSPRDKRQSRMPSSA